jgi:DNA-binding transcriptional regulator WhiA
VPDGGSAESRERKRHFQQIQICLRLLQPELSLSELAETFDPPLTKSCLNHRMRKLMELAGKEKA